MTKENFKIGDEVELIENNGNARKGATAKIYDINIDFIYINWVKNSLSKEQSDGGYYPSSFKIINKTWRERYEKN